MMKFIVKQIARKVLHRKKARLALWVMFVPVSFMTISFYRLFDFEWYKSQFTEDDTWMKNRFAALTHYLLHGRRRGLTPSPFFIPEYFDARNWQGSIIDPLTRYIFDKKNWSLPTSILFNPQKTSLTPSRFLPPLAVFTRALNDYSVVPMDIEGSHTSHKWVSVKKDLIKSNKMYQSQERLRNLSRPVYDFDYKLEKEHTDRYSSFKSQDTGKAPLVSIVMPVWNRQDLVADAIKSVQAQTFKNWELVITDDESSDNSVEVIKKMQRDDDRIKLLQPGHGGVCKARNSSLKAAKGKWIAFLDSDNTWTPDYLQTMLAAVTDKGYQAAYSAIEMEGRGKSRYRTTKPNPELLQTGNYVDLNALVVSRSVLGKVGYFDERLRRMVDYDLVCRISHETEFIYVPIIGVVYTDHDDTARITTTELVSWDGVVKNNNFIDWSELQTLKRKKDTCSVIIPISGDIRSATRSINAVLNSWHLGDSEIILADSSSSSSMNILLSVLAGLDERMRYHRFPASHDNTLGVNYGFSVARGQNVVIIDQRSDIESAEIANLLKAIKRQNDIVAPLQLHPHRTIFSAGVGFLKHSQTPVNLLENHPLSDAKKLPETYEVAAVAHGCIAMRAELFADLHGFYPLLDKGFEYQDFCLRAAKQRHASISVVPSVQILNTNPDKGWGSSSQQTFQSTWQPTEDTITTLYDAAGFKAMQYRPLEPRKGTMSKVEPLLQAHRGQKRYRWAIKIAAPSDKRRHLWGDVYYAEGLAKALENLGQTVAIDYRESHYRSTSYLDDINLIIRGLDLYSPQPNALNIMWVISHPDMVTTAEINLYDKVYAAGKTWADFASKKSGGPVGFLPQCTDSSVFKPDVKEDERYANQLLFVGSSRNILRPIVRDTIAAGYVPSVYGGGWNGLIDKKYLQGTFITNSSLTEAYGSSRLVLNDHWEDMRKWGFISNRIFDAVASGAYVVTDEIEGLRALFDVTQVRSYRDEESLKAAIEAETAINKQQKAASADMVRREHSFEARAEELLHDALKLL